MEHKKTVMQAAIDAINNTVYKIGADTHEGRILSNIANNMQTLLPIEMEQIIAAYNQDLYGGMSGNRKFSDGADYFNGTYKTEQ